MIRSGLLQGMDHEANLLTAFRLTHTPSVGCQ